MNFTLLNYYITYLSQLWWSNVSSEGKIEDLQVSNKQSLPTYNVRIDAKICRIMYDCRPT